MKKIFVITLLLFVAAYYGNDAKAQANWEVGVRGFDNWGIDATIPIGTKPRFHPTVYIESFGIGTYFDWMFALSDGPKGLKFYPGVGPEFFFENDFNFKVAGNFGVEYSFGIPITVGIDWRPAWRLTNNSDFETGNWGLTARFRFGEGAKFEKTD